MGVRRNAILRRVDGAEPLAALGVDRDASTDEIRDAYRKKAKDVLTDDEKRQLYDQLGHERFEQVEKYGAAGAEGDGEEDVDADFEDVDEDGEGQE